MGNKEPEKHKQWKTRKKKAILRMRMKKKKEFMEHEEKIVRPMCCVVMYDCYVYVFLRV